MTPGNARKWFGGEVPVPSLLRHEKLTPLPVSASVSAEGAFSGGLGTDFSRGKRKRGPQPHT